MAAKTAARSKAQGGARANPTAAKASAEARTETGAAEATAEATAAADPAGEAAPAVLRKKDFLDRVTLAAGGKPKEVRAVAEAVLEVLGQALAAGEELQLPPLGRARIAKRKPVPGGTLLTVKLRRAGGAEGSASAATDSDDLGLAEPDE